MMKHFTFVLIILLPLTTFAQKQTLKKFCKTVKIGKESKAKKLCTDTYWDADTDSGKKFFKQSVRKHFEFDVVKEQVNKDRAVLTLDIIRMGKKVDIVYMYMIKGKKDWEIDGVNEVENHVSYFLDGKISGSFHPKTLPGSKQLQNLAQDILNASKDVSRRKPLMKYVFEGKNSHIWLDNVYKLSELSVNQVFYDETLGRGVISFAGKSQNYREQLTIYVTKSDETNMWEIYTGAYTEPSLEAFLTE